MPAVGDKVRVLPNKAGQPPREGVVTAVSGTMLRIKWSTGEETSFIPGPGAVTVLGRVRAASAKKVGAGAAKKSAKSVTNAKPAKKSTKGKSQPSAEPESPNDYGTSHSPKSDAKPDDGLNLTSTTPVLVGTWKLTQPVALSPGAS